MPLPVQAPLIDYQRGSVQRQQFSPPQVQKLEQIWAEADGETGIRVEVKED